MGIIKVTGGKEQRYTSEEMSITVSEVGKHGLYISNYICLEYKDQRR